MFMLLMCMFIWSCDLLVVAAVDPQAATVAAVAPSATTCQIRLI
jgi:hypothetical protein